MSFKYKAFYRYTKLTHEIHEDAGLVPGSGCWLTIFAFNMLMIILLLVLMDVKVAERDGFPIIFVACGIFFFHMIFVDSVLQLPYLLLTKEEKRSLEKRFIKEELQRRKKLEEKESEEKSWRAAQWKSHQGH